MHSSRPRHYWRAVSSLPQQVFGILWDKGASLGFWRRDQDRRHGISIDNRLFQEHAAKASKSPVSSSRHHMMHRDLSLT
jgi:hypothetical protein